MKRLLLRAALIPILITLLGLHARKRGPDVDTTTTDTDSPEVKRRRTGLPGRSHSGDAAKTKELAAAARPKNAKQYPGGHYRTPDGKYAGSDGRQQDGSKYEDQVIDHNKHKYEDHAYKGPASKTTEDITATVHSGPRKGEIVIPAGTPRYYDGFLMRNGKWYGVETKSGSASKTPEQRAIDAWLNQPGNTLTTTDGKVLHGVITFTGVS